MYIAIQVQATKERWVMKSLQQRLESFGQDITMHLFEHPVVKLIGQEFKEVRENVMPNYLVAEIKGVLNDSLYNLLSNCEGVLRVLHQKPVSDEEFARMQEAASRGLVRIGEPSVPRYRRDNRMINRLEKALAVPSIGKATARRLLAYMSKIREQHRQYRNYIRHINFFAPFKAFTGRRDMLEFPLEALAIAKRRLFDIPFGWNDPVQLAHRLWFSMEARLE